MKCKRAKQELALGAGRDLDAESERELRRHLVDCPDCQSQWERLCCSTALLQHVATEKPLLPDPQLWSSLSQTLPATPFRRTFSISDAVTNTWVPLVAVASLLLAFVSINRSMDSPSLPSSSITWESSPNPNRLQPVRGRTFPDSLILQPVTAPVRIQTESPVEHFFHDQSPTLIETDHRDQQLRTDFSYERELSRPNP